MNFNNIYKMSEKKNLKFVKRFDICRLIELEKNQCKQFSLTKNVTNVEGFVIKTCSGILAYKNACPHTGAELNWKTDQFLNADKTHIICSIHGALFRLHDGFCVAGPCVGKKLQSIPVSVQKGLVFWEQDNRFVVNR